MLQFYPKELGLKTYKNVYPQINISLIKRILKRCGKYLKKISIKSLEYNVACLITKYCRNIQSITCDKVSVEGLQELSINCKNISELYITDKMEQTDKADKVLAELFSNNKKFRIFHINSLKVIMNIY